MCSSVAVGPATIRRSVQQTEERVCTPPELFRVSGACVLLICGEGNAIACEVLSVVVFFSFFHPLVMKVQQYRVTVVLGDP